MHRERQRSQGRLDSTSDYDSLGRLVSQRVAQNNSHNTTTNINSALSQISGVAQTPSVLERRYRYDQLGQLTELAEKHHPRSGRPEQTTKYSYDPLGRLAQAGNERFAFDPAHNLINPDGSAGNSADQSTNKIPGRYDNNRLTVYQDKRFSYDAHGNLTLKKTGAHTTLELKWDTEHQLISSRSTSGVNTRSPIIQDTRYAYDAFGRRISKTDRFGTTHFAWDGNRLLSEQRGSRSVLYLYEPGSFAPLAQLETAVVTTAAVPKSSDKAAPAAVSSIKQASSRSNTGASSYEIRSGERKQSPQPLGGLALGSGLGQGLGFGSGSGLGQVVASSAALSVPSTPALPLSSAASLRGFGRLDGLGSLDTTDPATQISTGQILAAQLDGEIPAIQGAGQENQIRDAETNEPTVHTIQRLYYYQNDQLGTPRELTSPDGDIAWSATYQAWGNTVKVDWTQTNEALQPTDLAANEPVHQPIRFQGQYFDAETGLHYNRFRYYDPDVGRFVSQDPIGLVGGDNLYAYAPNPTGWLDPLGLTSRCRWDINMNPLEKKAHAIHGDLLKPGKSPRAFNNSTVAVATVRDSSGNLQTVAGTSTGRFSPLQRATAASLGVKPIEVSKIGGFAGHAERVIIEQWAEKNGGKVIDIAASRPICPECAKCITGHGANPVSPLKRK